MPQLKPILETWIRNVVTHQILSEEVEEDLAFLKGSLNGSNGRQYLVAQTHEGKLVGVIGLSPVKQPLKQFAATEKPIELVNAYVDRNYRAGQGVGTALVGALRERAEKQGFKEVLLDSGPRYRFTGWGFWDKQPGFRRVGVAKNLYGPGNDALVWQRLLS
jgi:ribosomal protein S18 acetylase RimI-like enzyme